MGAEVITPTAENIKSASPYLRVFPEPETVFAEPVARYAYHLNPMISVDLNVVNPLWQGWVHLVNPIEPYEGYVGEETIPFHQGYLQANWLAFHLNDACRYELAGDFRYFYLENTPEDLPGVFSKKKWNALKRQYDEQHLDYQRRKAAYQKSGALLSEWGNACQVVEQLGENPPGGNWTAGYIPGIDVPGVAPVLTPDRVFVPRTPQGTEFHFIASVPGWNYRDIGTTTLLFYEPQTRIALLTFDWS